MMNKPVLSICIATYNRANFIGETLESIIPQLDDDVEILVVDGASTDNTEDVLCQYTRTESRIRYVRLFSKGGVDQDYDKSVQIARGEYCWLFTDDDVLRPGAIRAVKSAIEGGHDLIVVNAEVRNRDLSKTFQNQRISIDENKTYGPDDMEELFLDALNYLSFIGSVVIRRSIWLGRERELYFGTDFIHVGVIFQKPFLGTSFIISDPNIIIRSGNAQWTPRSLDIWLFKWPKLIWSFQCISTKAKQSICSKEPWLSLRALAVQRSLGSYNIQSYNKYFTNMRINVLWKFCACLIACFPKKIIIGVNYFYSRIKGSEARANFAFRFLK
jgi:glycosyltransferase involved in cell wall biosynthesis